MKRGLDKRLIALEDIAKPRVISTLADFVIWIAAGREGEVEISPKIQGVITEFVQKKGQM